MLVLTRKPRQQIMIGDDIIVNVVDVQGDNVRIAIDAPREVKIYRGEIYYAIQEDLPLKGKARGIAFPLRGATCQWYVAWQPKADG